MIKTSDQQIMSAVNAGVIHLSTPESYNSYKILAIGANLTVCVDKYGYAVVIQEAEFSSWTLKPEASE